MLAGKHLQFKMYRAINGAKSGGRGAQGGVTLLEVMVAVLVLSVGVLGAASLQLNAIRYSASAGYTTRATLIARDALDRMRANPSMLASYARASVSGACAPNRGGASIAAQDLADFTQAVTCQLPSATASITLNSGQATVTISWSETRTVANAEDSVLSLSSVIR